MRMRLKANLFYPDSGILERIKKPWNRIQENMIEPLAKSLKTRGL